MVEFKGEIFKGTLIRRYKRFFVDALLHGESGQEIVAHTPNTGSMKGLCDAGNEVLLTYNPSPTRKLHYTLQAIKVGQTWVGCNTSLPNAIVNEAIANNRIASLAGYRSSRPEVPYGPDRRSRIDWFLSDHQDGLPDAFVEVKNVTLRVDDEARFPDAVTTRGQKHLTELVAQVQEGFRAVMIFVTQRTDCQVFAPAADIDPDYARMLAHAHGVGVEMVCLVAEVGALGVDVVGELPIKL